MIVGFTGTQLGMTEIQMATLKKWLLENNVTEFHHGDCIGADRQAVEIVCPPHIKIHCHPPINKSKRAFTDYNVVYVARPYLVRNHDIVDECDILIAMPKYFKEERRSGTWATIRYAKRVGKKIAIIFPDGTIKFIQERADGK